MIATAGLIAERLGGTILTGKNQAQRSGQEGKEGTLMRTTLAITLGAAALAVPLLASAPAEACSIQVGNTVYEIEAVADHRPESEAHLCVPGILRYYDQNSGWQVMFADDPSEVAWVEGFGGTETPWGGFLVVVLDDGRVVFRWGDSTSNQLFVNDDYRSTFFAENGQGNQIRALNVIAVSTTPRGEVLVELEAESDQICSTKSDANGYFAWNWECDLNPEAAAAYEEDRVPEIPPEDRVDENLPPLPPLPPLPTDAPPDLPPPPPPPPLPNETASVNSSTGSGDWTSAFGQGSVEFGTYPSPGNSMMFACRDDYMEGMIYVETGGQPPQGRVRFIVDSQAFEFWSVPQNPGWMDTSCRACGDAFVFLWKAVRAGRTLTVVPDNGAPLTLSLKGTYKTLPQDSCEPMSRS